MGVLAPTNVTAVAVSGSSIIVEWENADEYDNIDLYRNVDGGGYVWVKDFDGGIESYLDTGLTKEKPYCYKLKGTIFTEEDEETSDFSDPPACATTLADLAAPSDLVATPISDTKVDLTFKVNSLVEDSVRIERKPDGGEYAEVAVLAPRRDFYRDTGLTKDQKYYWKVRVRKDDPLENSDYCTAAYATTIDNPATPTLADILDADTKDKSIRIRWSDVANETGYRIEMSIGDDSFGADEADLIAVVGAGVTDLLITGLTPGESYWVRMRAYNAAGNSSFSAIKTKTTDAIYVPTEFEKWIRNPDIKPIYLAEVNPKLPFEGFPFMKDSDLVLCLPMDETSGMTAYDKSASGNDGTLIDMEEEDHVAGKVNNGLKFDGGVGSGDYVSLASPHVIDLTSATIVFWGKRNVLAVTQDATNTVGALAVIGQGSSLKFLDMWVNDTYFQVYGERDVNNEIWANIISDVVADTDWHHFVITCDNNVFTLYIDGVQTGNIDDDSEAGNSSNTCTITAIGKGYASAHANYSSFWDGLLDEIRIYKRALTAAEVKELYDSPRKGFRLVAGKTYTYEHAFTDRVIVDFEKVFEDGDEYAEKASINEVEATASTFFFDTATKILYVHTSTGADPIGFYTEGEFCLHIKSGDSKTYNGNFYLPLLSKGDIPDITQEIKPYFEGNFGIASGSIAFSNAEIGFEHFFDKRFEGYIWINAKTIVKAGKDTFAYADFKEIFTALINSKSINDKKITFQLRDIREDMENKLILNKFDVTNYPDIEEEFRDKPIPVYLGTQNLITPIRVDEINERFKCNDGRIKSIDAVYRDGLQLVENKHYYVDLQRARITFDREGAFIITAGTNDKIDFDETGAELNATLDPGTYTTAELCAEIKAEMESVGAKTYTVTVDSTTKKFTIAGTPGLFYMLWKSGTNGSDGTNTHVGTTIGFADDEDSGNASSHEADEDVISIKKETIIGVQIRGIVNSADEVISNGAEVFKYLMNTYKGLSDVELNLDSIYEAKYANERKLAVPIESEISFDEIVRTIEHSLEAYSFQDAFGRLGIRPQQTTLASKVKYIISDHMFGHSQNKDKSTLYWKVNIYYNQNLQSDVWEVKTATDNEMNWKYKVTKELPIHTYFRDGVNAQALATSILSLLNKAKVEIDLPMLFFDVMPGDLPVFSRDRFYNSAGTANEITLRINRISKSPSSGRTSITAEVVS